MEFVYLRRVQSERGERLLPTNVNDDIALMKARTLLYVLANNQKLEKETYETHTLYYPIWNPAIKTLTTPLRPSTYEDIGAIIPVIPFKQVWEQPGTAYVFGDLENQALFTTYLLSSKRWLDGHPGSQEEIETKILEVAP